MLKFVSHDELNDKLAFIYASLEGLDRDVQSLFSTAGDVNLDYNNLVRLYNSELKQYKAILSAYHKLTSILLEFPEFKEKWDKFHEAPDYDRR